MAIQICSIVGIAILFYGFASEYFKRQKLQEELDKIKNEPANKRPG